MRETFVFDILCTYKLYVFRVLFAGNFHNSYLVRRHVPEEAIRHNISQRMMVCAATDSARARARAGNRKIRIPPTGVGACISNAAENADCRCQRLGGPTANFRQAVFHKSRRSLRVPQRVKQLYRRFSHPYVSSSPLSLSQM